MLFNSLLFLIFFPIVFFLYWFLFNKSYKQQNYLLIVASYYFYACWDWRFLFLLIFSTLLDYFSGIKINQCVKDNSRKLWLIISVVINLGFLFAFKYFNFFSESFSDLFQLFGIKLNTVTLDIILPVGISFYTFHGLSYVFDIYNRKILPTTNFIDYSLFVCFFPLLVAGPIERATHLLPQIQRERVFKFNRASEGIRLVLWGAFKKIVIADSLASVVDAIFNNYGNHTGSSLITGAVYFSIQIYCDFSGYTDIALGISKLLGFELLSNFKFPYFSRDIAEFWRRWHVSLSTWFRDYIYIPLGGSKVSKLKAIRNTFIIFLISGFWHGANWTFLFWGGFHALLFIPLLILNRNRKHTGDIVAKGKIIPSFKDFLLIILNFSLVTFAWIFFRSNTLSDGFGYIKGCVSDLNTVPFGISFIPYVIVFVLLDWLQRDSERNVLRFFVRDRLHFKIMRSLFFILLALSIILHFPFVENKSFIYFQF